MGMRTRPSVAFIPLGPSQPPTNKQSVNRKKEIPQWQKMKTVLVSAGRSAGGHENEAKCNVMHHGVPRPPAVINDKSV
jgi:hypothetical protein